MLTILADAMMRASRTDNRFEHRDNAQPRKQSRAKRRRFRINPYSEL